MMTRTLVQVLALLLLTWTFGCAASRTSSPEAKEGSEEPTVRSIFADFQANLKGDDAEKLWSMLSSDSQADAERAARNLQESYGKASAQEKAEQEKALGLQGTELASLTGKGFLKSKRFRGKYDEIPESKVERVVLQEDRATVHYIEADGDHEKLTLVRQEGQWKVQVPMPRTTPR